MTRQTFALNNCIYEKDWSSGSEQGRTEAQAKAMLNPGNDAITLLISAIQADTSNEFAPHVMRCCL